MLDVALTLFLIRFTLFCQIPMTKKDKFFIFFFKSIHFRLFINSCTGLNDFGSLEYVFQIFVIDILFTQLGTNYTMADVYVFKHSVLF